MSLVRLVLAISCPLLTKLANVYLYFSESEDEHPEKGVDGEIVDNNYDLYDPLILSGIKKC